MDLERRRLVIVGGGPIGCALAAALADAARAPLILEKDLGRRDADARTLVLSYGSRLILERLGVWAALKSSTPITEIHVSQRAAFGCAVLTAREVGVPALGYVARFSALHDAMREAAVGRGAQLCRGATVTAIEARPDAVRLRYLQDDTENLVEASLAAVADGGEALRGQTGTEIAMRDYGQTAVVAIVRSSLAHANRAYERFTPDGPVALLPSGEEYALVWSCAPAAAPILLALDDRTFLERLQKHFGDRAGRFVAVRERSAFPLRLRYAIEPVQSRVVLLGNAAQTLHPIAGQGFNLGLRDAWTLGETLRRTGSADPGTPGVLARYRAARRTDRAVGIFSTDALARLFSNDSAVLAAARGVALFCLDFHAPAKRFLMRRMMFGSRL